MHKCVKPCSVFVSCFFSFFLSRESLSLIFLVPQKFTKKPRQCWPHDKREKKKIKNQFLWSRNIVHPSASPQISPYLSSLALFCPLSSLLPSSFSRFWLLAPSQRGGTESQRDGKRWWRRLEGCWCKKQIVPEWSTQTHTVFFSFSPPSLPHTHTHSSHMCTYLLITVFSHCDVWVTWRVKGAPLWPSHYGFLPPAS